MDEREDVSGEPEQKNETSQYRAVKGAGEDFSYTTNAGTPRDAGKTAEDGVFGVPVVTREKKKDYKKIVPILCAVCAVVGGLIGGMISGLIVKKSDSQPETASLQSVYHETTTQQSVLAAAETTTANVPVGESTTVKSGTYTSSEDKPSPEFTFSAKEIYQYNVDSVVSIEVSKQGGKSYGTGFIISEEGYIVTNYHVVDGAKSVLVTLYDDRQYTATIVGYEEMNDIAVLQIKPDGKIQSLIYGVSSDLSVGDPVYIIGNPLGDLTFTLTTGVVSALNRLVDTGSGMEINMFQTDAAVNSGNSGGPVFDEHGYVVGIASAKYASASIEGLSFCIPIDDVRSMIDEIINKGYVSGKPVIGVSVYDREVTDYGFIQSTRSISGAKIAAVGSDTAAAKAGLQIGDIIVGLDGEAVTSVSVLRTLLADHRSGDTVKLTVSRNGRQTNISVTLDEYEPSDPRTSYSNVYDV